MREFTQDMLNVLTDAYNAVKGTSDFAKYTMETYGKINGRWSYWGWNNIYETGYFKQIKDVLYIYIVDVFGIETRYLVNDEVKSLLHIK